MIYIIKYEDSGGDCHIETIQAYHRSQVANMTRYPCKEIYWIKPANH